MPVIERIRRSPAYHILVGTELRREIKNFINRKIFQPLQNFGESLTYSQMIPLGPNGLKIVDPNLLMTALGPNGSSEKRPPFTTVQLKAKINDYLKEPKRIGKKSIVGGVIGSIGATVLGYFLPLKTTILALSPLSFVGLSSFTLVASALLPNIVMGFGVGFLLHYLITKPRKLASAREEILKDENHKLAWVLAEKVPQENVKMSEPLRKLLDEFTKNEENKKLLDLAREIKSEAMLKEEDKRLVFENLVTTIKDEDKEQTAEYLTRILQQNNINQDEIKTRIEKRINDLTPKPSTPQPQQTTPQPQQVPRPKTIKSLPPLTKAELEAIETRIKNNTYLPNLDGLNVAYKDLDFFKNNSHILPPEAEELKTKLISIIASISKTLGLCLIARDPEDVDKEYFLLPEDPNSSKPKHSLTSPFFVGKGNMGEVYKAFDPKTSEYVAVKLLIDLSFKGFFKREYEVMAKINSPSAVKVYGYGTIQIGAEHHPFIVEEFVPWLDLATYIKRSGEKFEPSKAAKITLTIADAMHSISQLGISHRDLKAANIFISERNEGEFEVKISDFGLARDPEAKDKSSTGHVMGTPTHISPYYYEEYSKMQKSEREDPKNQEHIRKILIKNDIFALGAILYRMLTGLSLTWKFEGKFHQIGEQSEWDEMKKKNPNSWLVQNVEPLSILTFQQLYIEYKTAKTKGDKSKVNEIKRKFVPVQEIRDRGFTIPDELYNILVQMTAFDPQESFGNFLEVKQALEKYLHNQPAAEGIVAKAPTTVSQTPPPSSKATVTPSGTTAVEEIGTKDIIPIEAEVDLGSLGAKPYEINNLQSVIGYLGKVQQDLLIKEAMTQEEIQNIYQNLQEIFSNHPKLQDLYAGPLQAMIIDRISNKGGKS